MNTDNTSTAEQQIREAASLTSKEINQAMLRLLADARAQCPGITQLEITAYHYDHMQESDILWSGHGSGGRCCSVSKPDAASVIADIAQQMGPDKVAQLRAEAAQISAQADTLESDIKTKPQTP